MKKNESIRKTNYEPHRATGTFDGAPCFKQVLPTTAL
jgi:hypothetical protein